MLLLIKVNKVPEKFYWNLYLQNNNNNQCYLGLYMSNLKTVRNVHH